MELAEVTSRADSSRRAREFPTSWLPGRFADSRLGEHFGEVDDMSQTPVVDNESNHA